MVFDCVFAVFWTVARHLKGPVLGTGSVTFAMFWTVVKDLSGLFTTSCQLQGALSVARGLVSGI